MTRSLVRSPITVLILASAMVLASACPSEDGTSPPSQVASSMTLSSTSVPLDAIGATSQLTATVKDQSGATISGAPVTWASDNSPVATVDATGLVTAMDNGTATITATSGAASAQASVTVAQAAGQVTVVSGDNQTAPVGSLLTAPLVARIDDRLGTAIAGASVAFTVSPNAGSVAPVNTTTDASGQVSTAWTLGTLAGTQQVTVRPAGTSVTGTFTATANPDVAAALIEVSGNNQIWQQNLPLPNNIVVQVEDQFGNGVPGHTVDFVVTSGMGSVSAPIVSTDANGEASVQWTLGNLLGLQTLEARAAPGLTGSPRVFSATATGSLAVSVVVAAGDGQTGLVANPVNIRPAVLVRDAANQPFQGGATVTFAVVSGGGSVTGATATTDASGIATVGSWILGAATGPNTLTATVTGTGITGNPVTFTATSEIAAFDVVVRFVAGTNPSQAQQQAFAAAEVFWETAIFGDLPSLVVTFAGGTCGGATAPAVNETVDDVVIYAELIPIDGPGGVFGAAGPCIIRSQGRLPALGGMRFDTDDLTRLETDGLLEPTIKHEMGHVLGFGSLWEALGFLRNKSDPARGGTAGADTHFDGPLAIAAFDDVGGTNFTGGAKVPVENDNARFGTGTLDGHWRESVFGTELMTPLLNSVNPLSVVSIASLQDMGYLTNYSRADAYALPGPAALVAGPVRTVDLSGDIWLGPIQVVSPSGRVNRILRRR